MLPNPSFADSCIFSKLPDSKVRFLVLYRQELPIGKLKLTKRFARLANATVTDRPLGCPFFPKDIG